MDQELSATLDGEKVIVGGYLNWHIGRSREVIDMIRTGGWGMRDRNDKVENIVDKAITFDLPIVDTFFEKKVNRIVTYNRGGRESQIDFLMCRRCHLKQVINCQVINGKQWQHSIGCWLWTGKFNGVRRENQNRQHQG